MCQIDFTPNFQADGSRWWVHTSQDMRDKEERLDKILRESGQDQCIIFVNTKRMCNSALKTRENTVYSDCGTTRIAGPSVIRLRLAGP